jgi:hypothetical protein
MPGTFPEGSSGLKIHTLILELSPRRIHCSQQTKLLSDFPRRNFLVNPANMRIRDSVKVGFNILIILPEVLNSWLIIDIFTFIIFSRIFILMVLNPKCSKLGYAMPGIGQRGS